MSGSSSSAPAPAASSLWGWGGVLGGCGVHVGVRGWEQPNVYEPLAAGSHSHVRLCCSLPSAPCQAWSEQTLELLGQPGRAAHLPGTPHPGHPRFTGSLSLSGSLWWAQSRLEGVIMEAHSLLGPRRPLPIWAAPPSSASQGIAGTWMGERWLPGSRNGGLGNMTC